MKLLTNDYCDPQITGRDLSYTFCYIFNIYGNKVVKAE